MQIITNRSGLLRNLVFNTRFPKNVLHNILKVL